jgi:hypothetical protein
MDRRTGHGALRRSSELKQHLADLQVYRADAVLTEASI